MRSEFGVCIARKVCRSGHGRRAVGVPGGVSGRKAGDHMLAANDIWAMDFLSDALFDGWPFGSVRAGGGISQAS